MNKQQQIDALRAERRELLTWFATNRPKDVGRAWFNMNSRLEEVHRQLDALTGEAKFHR